MTLEEYNTYKEKLDWGDWAKGLMTKALEGTGLRPAVEYIPAEYKEVKTDEGETKREMTMPEMYRLTITMPLEWRVITRIAGEDICPEKVIDITRQVAEFAREAWPDKMATERQYEMFRNLPGFFDWLTQKAPDILWRLTMRRLDETIGRRNILKIDLYDDLLIVNTRRGSWRIDYDNYRMRLEEVIKLMRPWMRRPIRGKFLRELRREKQEKNKTDNDDKNKG